MRLGILIKLEIYLFHKNYSVFRQEIYAKKAKNCDLDFSVEWFELLFRKIKLDVEAILIRGGTIDVNKWRQYCLVREIARFSERHVTRFRPITCAHFEMRHNKMICLVAMARALNVCTVTVQCVI